MRVTSNSFSQSLIRQLNDLTSRQFRLQNQAATGQRVELPEDDPLAMRRIIDYQAESKALTQFQKNIGRLQELSSVNYDSLKGLKEISDRAGEIATLADDLKSPEEMKTYATEITELIKQAVQLVNVQNRGDYVFGGTKTDAPPFAFTTDASGNITAVTYAGNTTVPQAEINPSTQLTGYVPGVNNSGTGEHGLVADSRTGADFFNHLISLQNNLAARNISDIHGTDQANLKKDEEHFLFQFGTNGTFQSRLETSSAMIKSRLSALNQEVSKEADADLAETLIRLKDTQTAYEAALKSGGTILNMSLMDFIR